MTSLQKLPFPGSIPRYVKLLLLAGMLTAFFWYIPFGKLYVAIRSANPGYFAIAVTLNFIVVFLATVGTWILATKQGIQIAIGEFYLFNLALRFYSFFSPASAVSTALRWHKLSAGGKAAEALSAISFTRLFSIVIAAGLGLFWVTSRSNQLWLNVAVFIGLISALITGWLLITRLSPYLSQSLLRWSEVISQAWLRRLGRFLARYFNSIKSYSQMPYPVLIWVALTHLGQEFLGLVAHLLLAWALGIQLSIYDLGALRALSFLTALTPFTLVGGLGLREVSLFIALSAFQVSPDLAAAFSLLAYARGMVFSALCGFLEFVVVARSK